MWFILKRLGMSRIFQSLRSVQLKLQKFRKDARKIHQVCIIGSGPAGFYAAQHLTKHLEESQVDIYEKLPVPFGLVRYGVAPDHPEVKNVTHGFTNVLKSPKVNFLGNVEVGKDVSFAKLQESYDAILLCYGAAEDRRLEIPGESEEVISGKEFVGWYNGLPENSNLRLDLKSKEKAFIIGQGNVALDIARILLSPVHLLQNTDISTYALEALSKSNLKEVVICGRRGPLQVAFTIKELRELINLSGVQTFLKPEDFSGINEELITSLPRPKRRLTDLMYRTMLDTKCSNPLKEKSGRNCSIKFFRSPLKIERKGRDLLLTWEINELFPGSERVKSTGRTEIERCDIIFRSVGYKGRKLFNELPFDENKGIIPNDQGRVQPGIYCCGWVGQGPRGVILSTMQNSFEVAKLISNDLLKSPNQHKKLGLGNVKELLEGKRVTTFDDYMKIAEYEQRTGTKVTTIQEMLRIANS